MTSGQSPKKLRLAINGFGRIGRNLLRAYMTRPEIRSCVDIIAINDVAQAQALLHLLRFDSTHGRLSNLGIEAELCQQADGLYLQLKTADEFRQIRLLAQKNPKDLPWQDLQIDLVLECTGFFRSYDDANCHRLAGAKQVIIGAAPFDRVDASIVIGVNDEQLTLGLPIVSGVSCTTQALVPLLAVLDKAFGIKSAMMTEIHALTADQNVLDQAHRDLRRARAGSHNIIPTTSSSIHATERVLPQMKGRINGHSIRVPTINVAAIDVTLVLEQSATDVQIKDLLRQVSQNSLAGIMDYTDQPLVSSDFIGDKHSLVIDASQIMSIGNQVKVFAWYDNEWGYANRLLDMCQILAKQLKA